MEKYSDQHLVGDSFRNSVEKAIELGKTINFQTYVLGDAGEAKLKYIITSILAKKQRIELMELIYTAAKELIVNSTKAAIKRLLLHEKAINPEDPVEYEKIMQEFKESLTDKKFPHFRSKMKSNGFRVNVKFYYDDFKIILKIINNFQLLGQEEKRIREKFIKAKKYDNLFEFYMDHSDNTEGAGMGITLVEILLLQSGYDRHLFTIYSQDGTSETIAKVEIPLSTEYKPKRHIFNDLLKEGDWTIEMLREKFGNRR